MTLTAPTARIADQEVCPPGVEPPAVVAVGGDGQDGVFLLLRRAGSLIDAMWRDCVGGGAESSAVALAEASQGVHRALIALEALERSTPPPG